MRVITGSARRLLLKALGGLDTRSTTDKTKETLFSMLQSGLADYIFLDLLSSSGITGIGTLSRGAGSAVMTEGNPKASGCIRENLSRTKLEERAMAMGCDVITGLKHLEGEDYKFNTVFMDPPYNHEHERLVLDYLNRSPMVTEEILIVIEASREIEFRWLEESGRHMIKSKEYKANKHVFVGRGEQMRTAIYPENFDPVTLSHYDIIEHTVKMVNKSIIRALNNKAKCPLFSAQERVNMLKEVISSLPNVEIQSLEGPLTDFMHGSHTDIVVGGLRAITDFKYELQIAQINRVTAPEIDTILLTTNLKYSYLSSSIVKETAEHKGDTSEFLHPVIAVGVKEKLEERGRST